MIATSCWVKPTTNYGLTFSSRRTSLPGLRNVRLLNPGDSNIKPLWVAPLSSLQVSSHVCLADAVCSAIRLKAYGQKMPIDRFLNNEHAGLDYCWAEQNEWDIVTSFDSPNIWLFAFATGQQHGIKHYPLLVPGSRGYGTVNLKVTHNAQKFSVKIYPRLVHVIKSSNSQLQAGIPKTLYGILKQRAAALRMIHTLTGLSTQRSN